jgi:asparagine synthase (glutamine-hydrolysing)
MRTWFGGIGLSERADILPRAAAGGAIDEHPFSSGGRSALRRILFYDQTSWLPDNLLERGDRMMMAHSVEGRMPFMDIELARLVARFPDRFLISHRRGKAVLRAALRRILPASILERRKVGFSVPLGEWFRGPYRNMICDLLASSQSETLRICHPEVVGRYVAEHMSGQQDHQRVLWMLANLELFIRTFKPHLGGTVRRPRSRVPSSQYILSEA